MPKLTPLKPRGYRFAARVNEIARFMAPRTRTNVVDELSEAVLFEADDLHVGETLAVSAKLFARSIDGAPRDYAMAVAGYFGRLVSAELARLAAERRAA